jgi:hypothetical protein
MGTVVSMLLIAVGAIMRFAVTVKGHGFNVHTTGVILIVIGIIGAVLSIVYWASWGGFGHNGVGHRKTVISTEQPVATVISTQQPVANGERPVVDQREVQ